MPQQFIHPNWHVLLVHLPLGLIATGLLIEVFSFFWPRSTVRTAGRWMLLLGALGCIPTLTLGLYAYRDVVAMGINTEDAKWSEVLAQSSWTDAQKLFMFRHIWLAVAATAVFVITAVVYLAAPDQGRRKLYWPALLLFIAAFGVLSTSAWYSGESVYTQATAVTLSRNPQATTQPAAAPGAVPGTQPVVPLQPATAPAASVAGDAHEHEHEHEELSEIEGKITYFLPPMQLHVLLAGLAVAFGLGAFGATVRRWTAESEAVERSAQTAVIERRLDDELAIREEAEPVVVPTGPHTPPAVVAAPPSVFPARIWLATLIFGVLTAAVGLWMTHDWRLQALIEPFKDAAQRRDILRLWLHILFGLSIVLLAGLLALVTRFSRRQRGFTTVLMLLFALAVAGQIWLGILLLYDSPHGPITGFSA